jgi:hypothetical protein
VNEKKNVLHYSLGAVIDVNYLKLARLEAVTVVLLRTDVFLDAMLGH